MKELKNDELMEVNGGGKAIWFIAGAIGILLIGILDGYRNPIKCHR